jgi:hypothetical protein
VVLPEFVVKKWWQLALHNQKGLFVKRIFLFEDRVVLSSVPFVPTGDHLAHAAVAGPRTG